MTNEGIGKRLSAIQLRAVRTAIRQGKVTVGMGRKNFDVHLHTAWALQERGFLRCRDNYVQTIAYPTPLARQLGAGFYPPESDE